MVTLHNFHGFRMTDESFESGNNTDWIAMYNWLNGFPLATPGGWLGKTQLKMASGIGRMVFICRYHKHKTTSGISRELRMVSGIVEGALGSTQGVTRGVVMREETALITRLTFVPLRCVISLWGIGSCRFFLQLGLVVRVTQGSEPEGPRWDPL